nr:triose-phosphate isomerase [Microlunatus antarcticus]
MGTSWKMTKTLAESRAYVEELGHTVVPEGVQAFLLPPLTSLHVVLDALPTGSPVLVGVQNAHWGPDGPMTGEVSMTQVRDAGAQVVEIGHSERRGLLGETDEMVAAKVAAALDAGLVPVLCVGEPWSVRSAGRADAYVADQVRSALADVDPDDVSRVVVAYEPVWAIGEGGRAAEPADVVGVLDAIRGAVADLAPGVRLRALLYGGSVTTENATDLLDLDLDGLFVGRAAWTAAGFTALLSLGGRAVDRRDELSSTHQPRSR